MPVAQLVTGQCRGQQHQWIIVRRQFMKKGHEGFVQCTQPATFDPAGEQQQQVVSTAQRGKIGEALVSQ